uniref:small monomeric GTPase n=1 Tax=Sinocyclocheilus rhinocerous TaxID=307959 RepID=A0A673FQK9_9TELE
MSIKKATLTENGVKNGTSRNVLERCASVSEYFDIAFKVMLLGDSAVGKTCILVRFKDGAFLGGNFIATVGIDFRNKVVTVDNMKVKIQVTLLLLYDITRKSSFDNIRVRQTNISRHFQMHSDMAAERVITHEEGEKLAKEYGVPFMETSAKTGVNVELAFHAIARELKHRNIQQPHEPKFKIHDYIESQQQKSNCCGGLM